jgi:hypothetical protein
MARIEDDDESQADSRARRIARQWGALVLMLWVAATVIAMAVVLSGCPRPPITPANRAAIGVVEQAWRDTPTLPDPGDCLEGARVLYTDRADFRDRCRAGRASDRADECLGYYDRGMFGRRGGWLVLIIDGSPTAERDIRHSILHALVACTLKRADKFDGNHTDGRVWRLVP